MYIFFLILVYIILLYETHLIVSYIIIYSSNIVIPIFSFNNSPIYQKMGGYNLKGKSLYFHETLFKSYKKVFKNMVKHS